MEIPADASKVDVLIVRMRVPVGHLADGPAPSPDWSGPSRRHVRDWVGARRRERSHRRQEVCSRRFADVVAWLNLGREEKVMAGQADGIQPRTIEVLQVGAHARPCVSAAATERVVAELRLGAAAAQVWQSNAHGE